MSVFIGHMKAEARFSPQICAVRGGAARGHSPAQGAPTEPPICLLRLPTHPAAPPPFYDCFLPPGFSAAAQRHFPGKRLQAGCIALLSFMDPLWVACPGFSTHQDRKRGNLKLAGSDLKTPL